MDASAMKQTLRPSSASASASASAWASLSPSLSPPPSPSPSPVSPFARSLSVDELDEDHDDDDDDDDDDDHICASDCECDCDRVLAPSESASGQDPVPYIDRHEDTVNRTPWLNILCHLALSISISLASILLAVWLVLLAAIWSSEWSTTTTTTIDLHQPLLEIGRILADTSFSRAGNSTFHAAAHNTSRFLDRTCASAFNWHVRWKQELERRPNQLYQGDYRIQDDEKYFTQLKRDFMLPNFGTEPGLVQGPADDDQDAVKAMHSLSAYCEQLSESAIAVKELPAREWSLDTPAVFKTIVTRLRERLETILLTPESGQKLHTWLAYAQVLGEASKHHETVRVQRLLEGLHGDPRFDWYKRRHHSAYQTHLVTELWFQPLVGVVLEHAITRHQMADTMDGILGQARVLRDFLDARACASRPDKEDGLLDARKPSRGTPSACYRTWDYLNVRYALPTASMHDVSRRLRSSSKELVLALDEVDRLRRLLHVSLQRYAYQKPHWSLRDTSTGWLRFPADNTAPNTTPTLRGPAFRYEDHHEHFTSGRTWWDGTFGRHVHLMALPPIIPQPLCASEALAAVSESTGQRKDPFSDMEASIRGTKTTREPSSSFTLSGAVPTCQSVRFTDTLSLVLPNLYYSLRETFAAQPTSFIPWLRFTPRALLPEPPLNTRPTLSRQVADLKDLQDTLAATSENLWPWDDVQYACSLIDDEPSRIYSKGEKRMDRSETGTCDSRMVGVKTTKVDVWQDTFRWFRWG